MKQVLNIIIINILFIQFTYAQTATVIWVEGDLSKEMDEGNWQRLKKDDEFNFIDKIKLTGENALAIFRISGKNDIEINGNQPPSILRDIYQYKNENTSNIEQTNSSWFSQLFSYNTKEGLGDIAGVSRGNDEVEVKDLSKKQFSFHNEVDILKNHDAVIYWEPSDENDVIYRLRLEILDDTTYATKDTLINISSNLLNECIPCEIKILRPTQTFNNTKVILFLGNLSELASDKLSFLENKIMDHPNISAYKYAKIMLLLQEGFIATAHSYFLKYLDDSAIKIAYDNFLKELNESYFQNN